MLVSISTRISLLSGLAAAIAMLAVGGASGMALARFDPQNPSADFNITAPADDPGWYNLSIDPGGGAARPSYFYLGDQWVITAWHTTGNASPTALHLENGTFNVIPGTDYQLSNPAGSYWQLDFDGNNQFLPLTAKTDLRIFRVDTDEATGLRPEDLNPGLKPIAISSVAPSAGDDLVMMGIGNNRVVNTADVNQQGLYHYQVNTGTNPWTWTELDAGASGGNYHGFRINNTSRTKRWGTNEVSLDSDIETSFQINDADNNLVTTRWRTNGTKITDVLNIVAKWDKPSFPSGQVVDSDEALATGGDSGGPVFTYNDAMARWELAGILNSVYVFNGQNNGGSPANGKPVYGNWTAFADLSNPHYYQQIAEKRAQLNYSIMGDINLDGKVTGDGTGAWENDDVTAFIDGWAYSQPEASILTWKRGDLNQDGLTDLSDFVLLRDALGGTIASGEFGTFVGGGGASSGVPEPRSWLLLMGILGGWWWLFRPRRRWATAAVHLRS